MDKPIIKKVSIPCQFFNKLPVDIIGQNRTTKLIKPIFVGMLLKLKKNFLNIMNTSIKNKPKPMIPDSTNHCK